MELSREVLMKWQNPVTFKEYTPRSRYWSVSISLTVIRTVASHEIQISPLSGLCCSLLAQAMMSAVACQ